MELYRLSSYYWDCVKGIASIFQCLIIVWFNFDLSERYMLVNKLEINTFAIVVRSHLYLSVNDYFVPLVSLGNYCIMFAFLNYYKNASGSWWLFFSLSFILCCGCLNINSSYTRFSHFHPVIICWLAYAGLWKLYGCEVKLLPKEELPHPTS